MFLMHGGLFSLRLAAICSQNICLKEEGEGEISCCM